MNAVMWLLAGGVMGWLAFTALRINVARGLVMSVIIGAMSAYFGGSVLAPLLGSTAHAPGEFNLFGLVMATAFSAACIFLADVIYHRFEV